MKRFGKKLFCVIAAASILQSSSFAANPLALNSGIRPKQSATVFRDVKSDSWYYNDVTKIVNSGIMKGKTSNTFDPDGKITNAEIAQILKNLQVAEALDKSRDFADVPANAWYSANARAYGAYFPYHYDRYKNVVEFWPDWPIDRSDLAYTLLQSFGYDDSYMATAYMELTGDRIIGLRRYPFAALEILASKGIIFGYENGDLGDSDSVSRAQCAAILNRFLQSEFNKNRSQSGSNAGAQLTDTRLDSAFYSITIPASWGDSWGYRHENWSNVEGDLAIYEKQSYADGYGGELFRILLLSKGKEEEYEFMESVIVGELTVNGYGTYLVIFRGPTDVQYSEAGREQYKLLQKDIDKIIASFQIKDGISGQYTPYQ